MNHNVCLSTMTSVQTPITHLIKLPILFTIQTAFQQPETAPQVVVQPLELADIQSTNASTSTQIFTKTPFTHQHPTTYQIRFSTKTALRILETVNKAAVTQQDIVLIYKIYVFTSIRIMMKIQTTYVSVRVQNMIVSTIITKVSIAKIFIKSR